MPDINYWAVLVAGLSSMVLGGLWYGPLFGKLWIQGQGWDPKDEKLMAKMKKSAGPAYVQQLIGALIMAGGLAHVIAAFSALPENGTVAGLLLGLQGGFWMWFGFILPVKYGDSLWNRKKFKFVAVDLGYWLVLLFIMGAIIGSWR